MIDVLIASRNASWCLPECIASIESQTLTPDTVWIGVDQCPDTADTAQLIQQESNLNIRVVYFPNHSWPFRIKNTLALLSKADVITTFDSDDLMHETHIEMMTKGLTPDRFARAYAMKEEDGDLVEWDRAHGVIAIHRDTFILMNGFESWKIAGDTEAITRWQSSGLLMIRPKEPTMTVRKHEGSITLQKETGYKSKLRQCKREQIKDRAVNPVRIDRIATAPFVELHWPMTVASTMPPILSALPIFKPKPPVDPSAVIAIRGMVAHFEPGFDRKQRESYKVAKEWLRNAK